MNGIKAIEILQGMKDGNVPSSYSEFCKEYNEKLDGIIKLIEEGPTVDEVRSREIALSMIVTLVEEIRKGSSVVSEIDIETITDLAYNIRYDTRWRIMKIRYRRV
jgi:hypothetical protein